MAKQTIIKTGLCFKFISFKISLKFIFIQFNIQYKIYQMNIIYLIIISSLVFWFMLILRVLMHNICKHSGSWWKIYVNTQGPDTFCVNNHTQSGFKLIYGFVFISFISHSYIFFGLLKQED